MKNLLTLGLAVTLCAAGVAPAADFPFAEATIESLQVRMAAGTLTAHELTAAYLRRIAEIDRSGPKLNAVLELNPDALTIADGLDAERREGHVRGPLHGIPVLLKDNLDTADRMETTAGSLALVGQKPPRDAHVVARLREAGAVILGKTNLSEWANFRGRNSCSGWSARGGQTRNPYALDRNPSGSSSGSAVAVAANLCVVAIGTETDGSIVSPASACGIVGIKPTVGLVSRAGIIPISASQDTAGPMARTVRDAALVLAALAGPDARDAATQEIPAGLTAALAAPLPVGALKGARIGLVRGPFGFPARMEPLQDELAATLRAAGAEVIDPVKIPTLPFLGTYEGTVLSYEFKDGLERYLAEPGRRSPMKTIADLIAFNRAHREQELFYFDQERLEEAQTRGPLTEPAYLEARALARRLARTEGVEAALDDQKLDALIMFTRGVAGLTDPYAGEASTGGSSSLAAVAGCPAITLPAASLYGLPIGVSFVGRSWSEARLLALAADFEAKAGKRRAPEFLNTIMRPGDDDAPK
ncbi:MAG TPA: amidase [Chthoniobacteraceae bacterium]|jgi:amidase|nr:amidase [Chthoniobacteraceae bacterium]